MSRARDFADLAGSADAGGLTGRNLIINGACVIDQRNSGSSVTTSGSYPVDRFFVNNATDATFSAQQSTDVPSGQGFTTSLKITFPTGDASIGTTQYANIQQYIEGFNVANLGFGNSGAKTVPLSFWVKASVTGQYSYAIYNSAEDRVNPQAFTINTADTWEFKSITYTGDTTGTWLTTNGKGLVVTLYTALGSSFLGSAGWNSGGTFGVTGQANAMASNGNTFYITGVQLEVGDTATPFEHEDYGTTLGKCQRYFETSFDGGVSTTNTSNSGVVGWGGYSGSTTTSFIGQAAIQYRVSKRAQPTVTIYDLASPRATGALHRYQLGGAANNGQNATVTDNGTIGFNIYSSGTTAGTGIVFHYTSDAEL